MRAEGTRHGNKVALKIIAETLTDVAILTAFTDVKLRYSVGSNYSCDKGGVEEVFIMQYENKEKEEVTE